MMISIKMERSENEQADEYKKDVGCQLFAQQITTDKRHDLFYAGAKEDVIVWTCF